MKNIVKSYLNSCGPRFQMIWNPCGRAGSCRLGHPGQSNHYARTHKGARRRSGPWSASGQFWAGKLAVDAAAGAFGSTWSTLTQRKSCFWIRLKIQKNANHDSCSPSTKKINPSPLNKIFLLVLIWGLENCLPNDVFWNYFGGCFKKIGLSWKQHHSIKRKCLIFA